MATIQEFPKCPKCGGAWKYYDGALGYESLICEECGLDIGDVITQDEAIVKIKEVQRAELLLRDTTEVASLMAYAAKLYIDEHTFPKNPEFAKKLLDKLPGA